MKYHVGKVKIDYLCNNRRLGSGNVSNIAERIALIRASLRSISNQIDSKAEA